MATRTPAGWLVASHSFDDDELPIPFDSVRTDSNNVGAAVWIHLASGAMIAAIPPGPWRRPGRFAFYYTGPLGVSVIPLKEWTDAQQRWDGTEPNTIPFREAAIDFFNRTLSRYGSAVEAVSSDNPLAALGGLSTPSGIEPGRI